MKRLVAVAAVSAGLAGTAYAAEFQPMGTLGIGGAGVARVVNGYAPYWNPAGLAFSDQTMSIPLDVSVGLRVSKGLADNVDKLGKYTEKDALGNTVFDNFKNIGASSTLSAADQAKAVADTVGLISIFKDIEAKNGTVSVNSNAALALQVGHFGTGIFGSMEGFAKASPDMVNIMPGGTSSSTTATATTLRTDILNAVSTQPTTVTTTYFTASEVSAMQAQLAIAGFTLAQQNQMINAIGSNLATSGGAGSTVPAVTSGSAAQAVTTVLAPALDPANTGTNSIDNNKSAVLVKSLAFVEIPFSYGYPIDLGTSGKLGVGATLKVISGRVYQTSLRIFETSGTTTTSATSSDISKNFQESFEETNNITFDLGTFYKYGDWFNWGLVAKNLTSPKFKAPVVKDAKTGVCVDKSGVRSSETGFAGCYNDADVTIKPQLRTGIAIEPLTWLTFAADLDLTENESILSGLGYKSRNLGGGVEFHPGRWFKVRVGAYKNLANDEVGPVATGGFTFGLPWINFEVDGAYGLETTQFKEKSYPREARVQAQFNLQF